MCFPVNVPKVLVTAFFFRTTPATAFEVTLKKESAEIAFALISLFHVQI